jgi:hypothetical protein
VESLENTSVCSNQCYRVSFTPDCVVGGVCQLVLALPFRSEALLEPCHSQSPRAPLRFTNNAATLDDLLRAALPAPRPLTQLQAAPNRRPPLSTASIYSPHTPPSLHTSQTWLTSIWPMRPQRRRRWPRQQPVLIVTRSVSRSRRWVQTLEEGCTRQS